MHQDLSNEETALNIPTYSYKHQPCNFIVTQFAQLRKGRMMCPWLSLMYSYAWRVAEEKEALWFSESAEW